MREWIDKRKSEGRCQPIRGADPSHPSATVQLRAFAQRRLPANLFLIAAGG